MTDKYEVIVGNIGMVYSGDNLKIALRTYREYCSLSLDGIGRAAYEDVTLLTDGEIDKHHDGCS
jgi:hypothetical protein